MARKKKAPEFDADYDAADDIVPGGGIPDDDGVIYLRRNRGREATDGKSKARNPAKAKGTRLEGGTG
jgi:hypothetical protein